MTPRTPASLARCHAQPSTFLPGTGRQPSLPSLSSPQLSARRRAPSLEELSSSPRPRAHMPGLGPTSPRTGRESRAAAWGLMQLRPNTPAPTLHPGWAVPAWLLRLQGAPALHARPYPTASLIRALKWPAPPPPSVLPPPFLPNAHPPPPPRQPCTAVSSCGSRGSEGTLQSRVPAPSCTGRACGQW